MSLAGLLWLAEHCCIVSSPVRREGPAAGAVGNAAFVAASARAGSTFCWASAGTVANESARIARVKRMAIPSTLQAGNGDLAALGLFDEKRDQRHAGVRAHL